MLVQLKSPCGEHQVSMWFIYITYVVFQICWKALHVASDHFEVSGHEFVCVREKLERAKREVQAQILDLDRRSSRSRSPS